MRSGGSSRVSDKGVAATAGAYVLALKPRHQVPFKGHDHLLAPAQCHAACAPIATGIYSHA